MANTRLYLCPFHQDKNPSLKVYESTGTFYCFGCHKSGKVVEDGLMDVLDTSTESRVSYTNKELYKPLEIKGYQFLELRGIRGIDAHRYGVRGIINHSLLFPLYDFNSIETDACIIRYFDTINNPKYKLLPNSRGFMKYSTVFWHEFTKGGEFYLVESIIDGLSVYSKYGKPAIVCLGTKLSIEIVQKLSELEGTCLIYFDPDAYDLAYLYLHDIETYSKLKVRVIETNKRPYEDD